MSRLRLKAPSPALIISIIALFAAIGGTSYAAATIGTNDIKNKAVTNAKLAPNAVGLQKIKDGAIGTSKIANNAVGLGQLGAQRISATATVANGQFGAVTAGCPTGTTVLDGGGGFGGVPNTYLGASQASGNSWLVAGLNVSGIPRTIAATAVCIRP
jgi:hypothetical protein